MTYLSVFAPGAASAPYHPPLVMMVEVVSSPSLNIQISFVGIKMRDGRGRETFLSRSLSL
jgi:hypothetical protein